MMTSTPLTQQQQTDGRTVREVVEFNQELVNEVWCRRIFRQILQSLELQYAMQMPHRPISPDTVLVLDSGDPMLLPSPECRTTDVGAAWSEAGDLHDLAAVVHYSITREYPPAGPLAGRALPNGDEYSETFITAVDRCLAPDPAQRPHDIEQLRNLLGIVPLGPAIPAPAAPAPAPVAAPEPATGFLTDPQPAPDKGGMRRWLLLVAAATVLLAALGALFALLHQADSGDAVTLALPTDEAPAPADGAAPAPAPATPVASAETPVISDDPPAAAAPDAALAAVQTPAVPVTTPPAGAATAAAAPGQPATVARVPGVPAAAGATYKLMIKPWGMVQVDGVDRGASPPLKRLVLAPGQHTIRIVNPSFPEHTVIVNAVKGASSTIELDFTEEETE